MTKHKIHSSLSVFDYSNHKLCDLYDSQHDLEGQAFNITREINMADGIKSLSFTIPYMVDKKRNFRWKYLKNEYLIRLIYKGKTEWYIAQKPVKQKEKNGIYGALTCAGTEASLKTKNIYKEFDDTNGIGTIDYLVDQILAGTGWHRGYTDTLLEADGVTEKVRSLSSGNKTGALGLMATVCNLFRCYPVYNTDTKTVDIYNYNNRDMILEGEVGKNMEALSVTYNSADIITRLYVEGEYGDDGYIGIDSVNPTGLNYIFNFDYYREIGVFTQRHEIALAAYLEEMSAIKELIMTNTSQQLEIEDELNMAIGQCKLVVYYTASGFVTPAYVYGNPTAAAKTLAVGDDVVVMNNNGTFRYATIESTPAALIQTGDYGIAKFVTKAAGKIGAYEVQIEAKGKEIDNLQRKINVTTKPEKIAEYQAEIERLQGEQQTIYTQENGLYASMHAVMNADGMLNGLEACKNTYASLTVDMDEIESDFIVAMGDLLRDGYWNNKNYIEGQEQHLFDDANERLDILSRPSVSYNFNLIRLHKTFGVPLEDFKLNALFKIHDDELDVHENLFITKIIVGIDDESAGSIEVSNKDITINTNSLGALLSRMSQLSDLIEQKNTLYDRAKSIQKNGQIYTDRLNGQIDVLKTQILSTVSNWHTDEQGNIIFLAADGGSAMMLSGAGFMIANSKDDNDQWLWRTFGTGEGFTADEIVAGFISAERIEAGSISTDKVEPGFGDSLVITGNSSITALNNQIAPPFEEYRQYSKGEYINYDGVFYVFNEDFIGGTFEQAVAHLTNTSVATELELFPDKIVQYVSRKGFSKTFIQNTDPTLDPSNNVSIGDYWIVDSEGTKWEALKLETWQAVKEELWQDFGPQRTVYIWNGDMWVEIYNQGAIVEAFTRITQTAEEVLTEAGTMMDGKLVDYSTTDQTASMISTSVQSYVDGELASYSTTSQTSQMISLAVADKYDIVSGIDITTNGVDIAGNKYVKITANNTMQLMIDEYGVQCGDLYFGPCRNHYGIEEGDGIESEGLSGGLKIYSARSGVIPGQKPGNATADIYLKVVSDEVIGYHTQFYPGVTNRCYLGKPGNVFREGYVNYMYAITYGSLSSRAVKHDINPIQDVGDAIDLLEPVTFIYNVDDKNKTRYGLIYEDTLPIMPNVCIDNGTEKAINYSDLVPVLLKEIQSLRKRVAALEAK